MINSNAFIHLLNRQNGQLWKILLCVQRMLIVLETCSNFSNFLTEYYTEYEAFH